MEVVALGFQHVRGGRDAVLRVQAALLRGLTRSALGLWLDRKFVTLSLGRRF
jgi:hypothetical protein